MEARDREFRSGYEDPRATQLVTNFSRALRPSEQLQAMKAISDFMATQLPFMPLYLELRVVTERKGIKVFDARGDGFETAHLWDVE